MNILVIGCGNVGSYLANNLSAMGHDVSVVSSVQEQFNNLSDKFNGYTTLGVEIDREVLIKAGIENCEALAAVTSDDNKNLMIVQLARTFYDVPRVFARINDPKKNKVFNDFGIETICSTNLTVNSFCAALRNNKSSVVNIGGHSIIITEMDAPEEFIGKRVDELEFSYGENLIAIEHSDKTISKNIKPEYEFEKGDKLIITEFSD